MRAILLLISAAAVVCYAACRPAAPEEIPLPTAICVGTYHHHQPIPKATVYVKYNADSFPGYAQPPAYYDAVFYTGADARGCLTGVPEGKHWLVAFGYDSLYYPHNVQGSLLVDISLDARPKADTVMQVSEEH